MATANLKVLTAAALFICLALSIHLYQNDTTAKETGLPQNIIAGGGMAAVIMAMWLMQPKKRSIIITPFCIFFAAGFLLLLIPVLYTRSEWITAALWRLAGPLGGGIFYFTLLQYRRSRRFSAMLLYALLCAVAIETAAILLLPFFPVSIDEWDQYGSVAWRTRGIFQWPEAVGGFLVAGLILTLMMLVLPGFRLQNRAGEQWRCLLLALLLAALSIALIWEASQTLWLSAGLCVGLFVSLFVYRHPQRCLLAFLLIGLSVCVAILAGELNVGIRSLSAGPLDNARGAPQFDMLAMIAEKTWLGWGYGGFEYGFQHFRLHPLPLSMLASVVHSPGNEIMLWWVEGGLAALWGILLLLVGIFVQVRRALQRDFIAYRRRGKAAGEVTGLCLVLLSLFLNIQTAYPFYLSIVYWVILLLLLAMLDQRGRPEGAAPLAGREMPE